MKLRSIELLKRIFESETRLFTFLLVFRALNAFLVQTYFVADEYWQSIEVAHWISFGYGYRTWEWQHALRSALHPSLFATIYSVLRILRIDYPILIIKLPTIFQGLLQSYSEVVLFRLVRKLAHTNQRLLVSDNEAKLNGDSHPVESQNAISSNAESNQVQRLANVVSILSIFSWFHFYCSTRTLINSVETQLAILALDSSPAFLFNRRSDAADAVRKRVFTASKKPLSSSANNSDSLVLTNRSVPTKSEVESRGNMLKFIVISGLLFALRPTAAIFLVPIVLRMLLQLDMHRIIPVCARCAFVGIGILLACAALDFFFYGRLEIVQWNFARFNVLHDVGSQYGVHPYHWYFTSGLPTILGPYTPLFLLGLLMRLRIWLFPRKVTSQKTKAPESDRNKDEPVAEARFRGAKTDSRQEALVTQAPTSVDQVGSDEKFLLFYIFWTVYCLSFLGHKEFRFIYCVLPVSFYFAAHGAIKLFEKPIGRYFVVALVLINVPLGLYTTLLHQRGTIQVTHFLRRRAAQLRIEPESAVETDFAVFLMPCHSTPFYSHLHLNVSMRFLTCEPTLTLAEPPVDAGVDSETDVEQKDSISELERTFTSDDFYENPVQWLNDHYCDSVGKHRKKPLHFALFDSLFTQDVKMQAALNECGYEQCARIWHAHFPVSSRHGRYLLVFCRSSAASAAQADDDHQ